MDWFVWLVIGAMGTFAAVLATVTFITRGR